MSRITKIVIVGGGSSGWMSAALLAKLTNRKYQITLIESSDIATIGVGEATVPAIKVFNDLLGLDEKSFIQATQGTFKLGIQFCDWKEKGHQYMHAFGTTGRKLGWIHFYQYWLKQKLLGQASELGNYSVTNQMALQNKFLPAQRKLTDSPLSDIAHAYHIDAGLYAKLLSKISLSLGVEHLDGKVVSTDQHPESGFLKSVKLEDGRSIEGDLFIDCSGMRGLLVEQTLQTGFDDWSHWLPCDSAWAVATERTEPLLSYTRSTARESGWQWRIPLQHRTGNGYVYSSKFTSDELALNQLSEQLDSKAISEGRLIKFKVGKRKKAWNKNCVAIGLSSGFIEPLESTSLYLVQSAITRLIHLFPDKQFSQANIDLYNRKTDLEIESIRDLIIAHYKVTNRVDSEFWRHCRAMEVPDSLTHKLELFDAYGRIDQTTDEIFRQEAWSQVLLGQGPLPTGYDPMVDVESADDVKEFVESIESVIGQSISALPNHSDFIDQQCRANELL